MQKNCATKSGRKKRITDFYRHRKFHHWRWVPYGLMILLPVVPYYSISQNGFRSLGTPWDFVYVCFMLLCVIVFISSYPLTLKRLARNDFRGTWEKLRNAHPTECPWCGYDIRCCTTPTCSECGNFVDPPDNAQESTPGN